ncbi:MAG: O-succinylhomoserine sulfhydrylase [Rhodospirillaceae bacterium]|nr:O-succinylhomoserine sulfhydrylase [Rhodospirillaceae bacterium]RPF98659.1 MAG: O-succinylhomoserine sulfhydrylase [Rhodospirillaceae bacterium TMED63]RZO36990.1 MAG: O-succinylhomoserine sulfhydrylase [Rhodospirillaceae bacterium]
MAVNKPVQDSWRAQTLAVRGGTRRSEFGETGEAIFATSGYVYEYAEQAEDAFRDRVDRFIYSRFSNPTVDMFQDRMALIEGADMGKATATGMSAVFASMACMVEAGDHVVGSRALFGSCLYILTEILPKYGVETTIVDGTDLNQWEDALKRPTKCAFVETPSNPGLDIIDIQAVADLAHKAGAKVIVDNVFATPMLQKPLQLGADIVVYSATKHIDGQGRCLGGIVLGGENYCENTLKPFLRHTGPSLSPFNAWVMLKGLETLDLRIRRHCENARVIADYLETRSDLAKVRYPGLKSHPQHDLAARQMSDFGNVVAFSHEGGKEAVFRFMNAMKLIDISNNLGDSKSLLTHPATTTHQRLTPEDRASLGLDDGMVRLSVGLENPLDVLDDLEQAFAAV